MVSTYIKGAIPAGLLIRNVGAGETSYHTVATLEPL
jgi:hypothetical protein